MAAVTFRIKVGDGVAAARTAGNGDGGGGGGGRDAGGGGGEGSAGVRAARVRREDGWTKDKIRSAALAVPDGAAAIDDVHLAHGRRSRLAGSGRSPPWLTGLPLA